VGRFYVPLDVNYQMDPKILAAGASAECLYVRGLALCKRGATEGQVHSKQLQALALGLPGAPMKLARALVDAGLWVETGTGWYVVGWLKHNMSNEALTDHKARVRARSVAGNHQRHHVDTGRFDPNCELCNAPSKDNIDVPSKDETVVPTDNERERERDNERDSESEFSSSSQKLHSPEPGSNDWPLAQVINLIAAERTRMAVPRDPTAYRRKVAGDIWEHEATNISALMTKRPDLTHQKIADHYEVRYQEARRNQP
jgi:hypothetical protein